MVKYITKILIGDKAMSILGTTRLSESSCYLVLEGNFIEDILRDEQTGSIYVNALGNAFYEEIYRSEKNNLIASPQAMLNLRAYDYIQYLNGKEFEKAAQADYDIRFLIIRYKLQDINIAKKHLSKLQLQEIENLLKSIKK